MSTPYKRESSSGTLAAINAGWAMVFGSILVWRTFTDVLPHLVEDGMNVQEMFLFSAFVFGGIALTFPSRAKALLADFIEARRELKTKDDQ